MPWCHVTSVYAADIHAHARDWHTYEWWHCTVTMDSVGNDVCAVSLDIYSYIYIYV